MYIYSYKNNRVYGEKLRVARVRCTSPIDSRFMRVYVDGGLFTSSEQNNDYKRYCKKYCNGLVTTIVPVIEGVSYCGRLWLQERDDALAQSIIDQGG